MFHYVVIYYLKITSLIIKQMASSSRLDPEAPPVIGGFLYIKSRDPVNLEVGV